jgi:hypothetical protein
LSLLRSVLFIFEGGVSVARLTAAPIPDIISIKSIYEIENGLLPTVAPAIAIRTIQEIFIVRLN